MLSVTPSAAYLAREHLERRRADRDPVGVGEHAAFGIGSRTAVEPTSTHAAPAALAHPGERRRSTNAMGPRARASACAACHCSRVKPSGSGPPGGPPVLRDVGCRSARAPASTSDTRTAALRRGPRCRSTSAVAPISAAVASTRSREREAIATRAPSAISSAAMPRADPLRRARDERDLALEARDPCRDPRRHAPPGRGRAPGARTTARRARSRARRPSQCTPRMHGDEARQPGERGADQRPGDRQAARRARSPARRRPTRRGRPASPSPRRTNAGSARARATESTATAMAWTSAARQSDGTIHADIVAGLYP